MDEMVYVSKSRLKKLEALEKQAEGDKPEIRFLDRFSYLILPSLALLLSLPYIFG